MKLVETLSPRDYSSETIARLKHGDDAKTLDKAWCAVSLRNSHRALSSVLSGVIGMSCLHDFHAHDLLLVNCFCMRKIVFCNWFLSVCWWLRRSTVMLIPPLTSRLSVTNGVWPLVDCRCKESFEVFSAVRVSQLMYAFVCKFPAWNLFPCGSGLHWVVFTRVHPGEVAVIQRCNTVKFLYQNQPVWFWWGFCSVFPENQSNLVDSASSHTLVSKIKPCTSKYKYYIVKLRMAHYISYSLFDSPLLLG